MTENEIVLFSIIWSIGGIISLRTPKFMKKMAERQTGKKIHMKTEFSLNGKIILFLLSWIIVFGLTGLLDDE